MQLTTLPLSPSMLRSAANRTVLSADRKGGDSRPSQVRPEVGLCRISK